MMMAAELEWGDCDDSGHIFQIKGQGNCDYDFGNFNFSKVIPLW